MKDVLNKDLDVFDKYELPGFFLREPYEGELAFDFKNERINELQFKTCHRILCSNDGRIKGLTEYSFDRQRWRLRKN